MSTAGQRGPIAPAGPGGPRFDEPTIEGDTAEWWEAAADGRLLLRRCGSCGEAHFYPRPFCPICWSDEVAWEQASGRATLYTWSTVYQNDLPPFGSRVPYVAAVVTLEEGPRMMTNVVDCDPADLAVDLELEADFRGGGTEPVLVVFRPSG